MSSGLHHTLRELRQLLDAMVGGPGNEVAPVEEDMGEEEEQAYLRALLADPEVRIYRGEVGLVVELRCTRRWRNVAARRSPLR